jgi:predicted metalloendopeptidase
VVFFDRVKKNPGDVWCILGHVIAHEVTHILQGVPRHSESGVMKAHWTVEDYQRMAWEPLRFTDYDLQLIQSGLGRR